MLRVCGWTRREVPELLCREQGTQTLAGTLTVPPD